MRGNLLRVGLITSWHEQRRDFRVIESALVLVSGIVTNERWVERAMVHIHVA